MAAQRPDESEKHEREDRSRRIAFELLKAKLDEREKLHGDYFRTTSIALVVLGACLKFSIDHDIESHLRIVLPVAGLLFTVVGLVSICLGEHARRAVESEIQQLLIQADAGIAFQTSLRLKYALMGFFAAGVIFLAGFAYVLLVIVWETLSNASYDSGRPIWLTH